MKKTIFSSFILISIASFSQKCSDYYYLQSDKIIEMTITNKKGKEVGKNIYTIADVKKTRKTTTDDVKYEFNRNKGKFVAKRNNNVKSTQGIMMMDLKMFNPSAQQEQMGTVSSGEGQAYLEYPANMKEGDVLKDGQ